MFVVCQLDNGRYVIQNTFTGLYVNKNGKIRTFRSVKKAEKYIAKVLCELNTTIGRLQKKYPLRHR